jgi:anti-sigma-K factor RskA
VVGILRRPQPEPIASSVGSLTVFAATPGTVARTIPDQADPTGVRTTLYTHSGDPRVGMRVDNLAPAPHGHTYQLWVASSAGQVSLGTFDPGQDGGVSMLAVAPASIDQYTDAMVTIEPTGGAKSPSEKVVWQIRL